MAGAEGGGHRATGGGDKVTEASGCCQGLDSLGHGDCFAFQKGPLTGMVQLGSGDTWALGDGCSLPVREMVGA